MGKTRKIGYLIVSLLLCLSITLSGCNGTSDNHVSEVTEEVQNLEKLCKVWGYVKYTHPAFLLGQKDWDEELLNMIPTVSGAKGDEVNSILHEWFVGLGDIDYQTSRKKALPAEDQWVKTADTGWIFDESYLGKELTADLQQLGPIPAIDRSKAPVNYLAPQGVSIILPDFSNEKAYEDMDYENKGYRLLGLFRLWNAMEYHYPYLDILDENWQELLPGFISRMLSGTDKHSYQLTLAALGAKLQDAHIFFSDAYFLMDEFGEYGASVELNRAEGKWVVWKVHNPDCGLEMGDVICKLEGKTIEEVTEQRRQYIATTTKDKLVNSLAPWILRSPNQEFEVTVLRDGVEQSLNVKGDKTFIQTKATADEPYKIIEGNIGVINPAALPRNEFVSIMEKLLSTDGLIIDFRQYPSDFILSALATYLVDEYATFATYCTPSQTIPGVFLKNDQAAGYVESLGNQHYEKKVVLLIDEKTQSQAEYIVMAARNGANVTVMGENSIGSDGDVAAITLPGGMQMSFTSQGIYAPGMEQVQIVGLSPDIEVHPTIAGIQAGRDELMEAAIEFILTKTAQAQAPQSLMQTYDTKIRNLEKLCKVWGYVKYTHPAFLLGEKDWDEELLGLIPQVQDAADEETVNDLLYQWYVGLGEIDYGTDVIDPV